MTGATLLGPSPGTDVLEAQTVVVGELSAVPEGVLGLPAMVQLPDRGWAGEPVGRAAGLLTGMPVELGPHGWRLADRPGRDGERLRSLLREDVDALAVAAHGWTGHLVVPVLGPWALASVLYLARGDRVLSDRGAVRDLVGSLGDGLAGLLAALRVAVPGAQPVLVLQEPRLPDVLRGTVPSFSGRERLRSVPGHDVGAALAEVVRAARQAGAVEVVADAGRRFSSGAVQVLSASGADSLGIGAAAIGSDGWEQLAALVEEGRTLWFGLPAEGGRVPDDLRPVARLVAGPWTAVGLPAAGLAGVVVHAEAQPDTATSARRGADALREDLTLAVRVAALLAERAADG